MLAGALGIALYLPFTDGTAIPLGAVPNVVAYIRFNGPVFEFLATLASPQAGAATAVLLGLAVAAWARWRLPVSDPAAWAWPMALSLACAPVIYPWYLLSFTPFLWSRRTIPLATWTLSSLAVYIVWHRSRMGGRWIVPRYIEAFEFGAVIVSAIVVLAIVRQRSRPQSPSTAELV